MINKKQKTKNKKWRIKIIKIPNSNKFGILKPRYQKWAKAKFVYFTVANLRLI